MTAFARKEAQTEQGDFSWEIRSVNHRYLEAAIKIDESFRPLEMQIRKKINNQLGRGKVDAVLRYKAPKAQSSVEIDQQLAQAIIAGYEQVATLATESAPVDAMRVLQWPGVIVSEGVDQDQLNQAILSTLEEALAELIQTRATEGAALEDMILKRCDEIEKISQAVRQRLPEILEQQRQRMIEKVQEFEVNLEPERLEQEMALLAQKTDVAEELDRLDNHIVEVRNVLKRNEPIGRRLDFLMQELNREANTLASKSIDTDTTRYSVDLKVLIEQMREQIQNIE
jgi:uncharacterized protein (TIGR00255 family)